MTPRDRYGVGWVVTPRCRSGGHRRGPVSWLPSRSGVAAFIALRCRGFHRGPVSRLPSRSGVAVAFAGPLPVGVPTRTIRHSLAGARSRAHEERGPAAIPAGDSTPTRDSRPLPVPRSSGGARHRGPCPPLGLRGRGATAGSVGGVRDVTRCGTVTQDAGSGVCQWSHRRIRGIGKGGRGGARARPRSRLGPGRPDELLEVLAAAERRPGLDPVGVADMWLSAQWAAVVAASQRVVNAACAVQDDAIASLAAIEPGRARGRHRGRRRTGPVGTSRWMQRRSCPGCWPCPRSHAERRVRAAVRMVADGPTGTETETGLGGSSRRDAPWPTSTPTGPGVVAEELEEAPRRLPPPWSPPSVSTSSPTPLRSCAGGAAPSCPGSAPTWSASVRSEPANDCALRRWAEEPGVDKWEGTFPSEDAARAWAAIDARAHQLVADGTCPRIDRARSQALIDLVTGSATIETVVTLTVPAPPPIQSQRPAPGRLAGPHRSDSTRSSRPTRRRPPATGAQPARQPVRPSARRLPSPGSPDDLIEVAMGGRGERVLVPRAFLDVVAKGVSCQGRPTRLPPRHRRPARPTTTST